MRKILTSSMIAAAALLVTACGDSDTAVNNTAANDLGADTMYDTNDMGMDTNLTLDGNMMGNGVDAALDNAAAATDNAAQAIENAQERSQ